MKIKFADYRRAAKVFKKHMESLQEKYERYLTYMKKISADGLVSGDAADAFKQVLIMLQEVQEIPKGLVERMERLVESYLAKLHSAQVKDGVSILYDEDYNGVRNYTDIFDDLSNAVENVDYDKEWRGIADWIEDHIGPVFSWLFNEYDLSTTKNIQKTRSNLLHYKDVTKVNLYEIKREIEGYEKEYAGYFNKITNILDDFNQYMRILADFFSGYCFNGTPLLSETIHKLSELYNKMVSGFSDLKVEEPITDEEIDDFMQSINSEAFRDPNHEKFITGMNEICAGANGFEYAKILLFNFIDVGEKTITGQDYQLYCAKAELLGILEEASGSFNIDDTLEKQYSDCYEKVLSLVKKYGENWKEHYKGDKHLPVYKNTVKFFQEVEKANKLMEYANEGAEIMSKLFTDYSRNLQFLDSIERNYVSTETTEKAFKEIRDLYEKNLFDLTINYMNEKASDYAVKALYSGVSISVGKAIGAVKLSLGFIGSVTGEGSRTQSELQLYAYGSDLMNMASDSFKSAVKRLKSMDETDPDYDMCLEDVKNCFITYKNTMSSLFKKMASASSGVKKDYYNYCARTVSNFKLSNYGSKTIMSFDEYERLGNNE